MPIAETIVVGDFVKVFFDSAIYIEGIVLYKPAPTKPGEPWIIRSTASLHYITTYSRISKEVPTVAP